MRDYKIYNVELKAGIEKEISIEENWEALSLQSRNCNDLKFARNKSETANNYYTIASMPTMDTGDIVQFFSSGIIGYILSDIDDILEIIVGLH